MGRKSRRGRPRNQRLRAFQIPNQLLKMKNSEDFKEVAATTSATTVAPVGESLSPPKPPDPLPTTTGETETESTLETAVTADTVKSNDSDISGTNNNMQEEIPTESVEIQTKSVEKETKCVEIEAKPAETQMKSLEIPPTASEESTANVLVEEAKLPEDESQTKSLSPSPEVTTKDCSQQPAETSQETQQTQEEGSSLSTMTPNVSSSGNASISNSSTGVNSVNDDEDAMTIDSSSDDDDDDIYINQFSKDNLGMGSDNNDPAEELVIKRNSEYLIQRCKSLMQRVQGVMQTTTARHVSRQLQSVMEHPGLNPLLRSTNKNYHEIIPPSQRLTKQSIAELQFAGKLINDIIRNTMARSLDPNDDSDTEESDTDDDEVVLPDDRMVDACNSEYAPYLPVENNPFMEAIKLEKSYETRRTSLEYSINECEYSLTKSLALRKHCKARKPCFQLEKPSTSTNVINIPSEIDAIKGTCASSNKPTSLDVSRVSDMIQRRPSLDDGVKTNGDASDTVPSISISTRTVSQPNQQMVSDAVNEPGPSSQSSSQQTESSQESNDSIGSFIPSLKTLGSDGSSVLGVEFKNSSDPNQSASRCAAIRRPEKNRKVFQLGGIQNIFRDPAKLPTVLCNCFGRDELCALCLGRSKRKGEVNHAYMNCRDKLATLDETFHKSLSFSEDIPLEVLLTSSALGIGIPVMQQRNSIQQFIKMRSQQFPPELIDTGSRPKKPRIYDIKPYVESPVRSPKKENRFSDEAAQSPKKKGPRKSQSSYEDRDFQDYAGKGLGWSRERKDSIRRTRNQEFDIDNIVIPYSMAATTRVEQLVYKPIETPCWRVLHYDELFESILEGKHDEELDDMSNAALTQRHNKCEINEKKKFTQAIHKAVNPTRKMRRLDSTCKSESSFDDSMPLAGDDSLPQLQSPEKARDTLEEKTSTPQVTENATVITEAMANQALKSLFKVGRRRTISTTIKVEEEEDPAVVPLVDPWPQRNYPIAEDEYKEMVEEMQKYYPDCPVGITSHSSSHSPGPSSPSYEF